MLRNRRKTVQEMDVLLDQSDAIMRVEYDKDERSLAIQEELDEWRIAALSSASLNSDYSQRLQQIFLLLFRASGTWLGILEWVVVTRLSSTINSYLLEDFDTESIQLLIDTPKFSREKEILERLLEIIQISHEYGDRIAHLIQVIGNLNSSHGQRKIVVFTSFSRTCREIFKQLSSSLGEIAIATYQQGQSLDKVKENTQKFRNHPDCFVLVSDSSGEEGHNLQFADWIVHFDIPLSPNRIEQRNGRLNRIGLTHLMQYIVFAGADVQDGLHDAWFLLLQDGFRIFKESIASLQFYVDEKLPKLEKILFQSGVDGIKQTLNIIQSEITQEKDRIDEQNTLDEIDALEDKATEYFQKLDDYDAGHKSMQQSVERWLCGTLHFGRNRELWQSDGIVKYFSTYGTLVTSDDIDSRFAAFLDRSMAYNRLKAIKTSDIQLCRIGNGLIDELASYIRWDDRGQAFAMWRQEESWSPEEGMEWVGFRFDYVVETDLSLVESILQNWQNASIRAIMRRADALFPPEIKTIFLDTQTNTVEDIQLLSVLQRPYYGKDSRDRPRDYNLGSRLHILDEFVNRDDWAELCQNARSKSEALLRELPDFLEHCHTHAQQTDRELSARIQQLQLRLERQNAQNTELSREVEIENSLRQVLINGIRHPKIRLDSIGFYIVSGRAPSGITEEEDV
jgi:ATP-dependent helicase HepA